jgi:hypothetical protein
MSFINSVNGMLTKNNKLRLDQLIPWTDSCEPCSVEFHIKKMPSTFDAPFTCSGCLFKVLLNLIIYASDGKHQQYLPWYERLNAARERPHYEDFEIARVHLFAFFRSVLSRSRSLFKLAWDRKFVQQIFDRRQDLNHDTMMELFYMIFEFGASPQIRVCGNALGRSTIKKTEWLLSWYARWYESCENADGKLHAEILLSYGASPWLNKERTDCVLRSTYTPALTRLLLDHDESQLFAVSEEFGWSTLVHHISSQSHHYACLKILLDRVVEHKNDPKFQRMIALPDKFGTTLLMHICRQMYGFPKWQFTPKDEEYVSLYAVLQQILKEFPQVNVNERNKIGFNAMVCLWWNGYADRHNVSYNNTRRDFDVEATLDSASLLLDHGIEVSDDDLLKIRIMCVGRGLYRSKIDENMCRDTEGVEWQKILASPHHLGIGDYVQSYKGLLDLIASKK